MRLSPSSLWSFATADAREAGVLVESGLAGLVDGSAKPLSCPHQMDPVIEARIVALRTEHPGWGPRTIEHQLARDGVGAVPGRSSIYRCLVRHGLIAVQAWRRKRSDYKRWERRGRWTSGRWTSSVA